MTWFKLIIAMVWAISGAIATRYYGKLVKDEGDDVFNPLTVYIGWCYMMAGTELAKFGLE